MEEEIKSGKKSKMINEYNKRYIEKFHFEEARAIFMMLTRMVDVKANYRNKYKTWSAKYVKWRKTPNIY